MDQQGRASGGQAGEQRTLVRNHTRPREEATVWDPQHPHTSRRHGRHTDADLYRHEPGGRVSRVRRVHIPGGR